MIALEFGRTQLSYVGARPYIRGADLLADFSSAYIRQAGVASLTHIRLFRLVRELERDGHWVMGAQDGASATLDFQGQDGERRRASFIEDGNEITARVADIPSCVRNLVESGDFAGRANLQSLASFADLVNAMIEVNKKLHQAVLQRRGSPDAGIRFVYLEDCPVSSDLGKVSWIEVLPIGERMQGGKPFSLVRLASDGLEKPVRICFTY